ncbi:MAG: septal ring lytic transglycosylase RlpA family protein [Patescibacteria group bacterium]
MRKGAGLFMVAAFIVLAFSARPAFASVVVSPSFEKKDSVVLYLDWGFVGRPVTLDLFENRIRVSWDAGDLTAPTILMVERERTATTTQGDVTLGEDVAHLTWADPQNLSERGVRVEVRSACTTSDWTTCSSYRLAGSSWTSLTGSWAYGHVRVRSGETPSSYMREGKASWYAYRNCRCAASPDFPKGTRVRVTSKLTGKYTVVRINDWGPERDKFPERVIDLDAVAFKEFAPLGAGVITVSVEPIGPDDPDYAMADAMPTTRP